MPEPARGIRNKNPGNIERTTTKWQGMAKEQTDPRFIVFVSPQYGIRAMAKTLLTYQSAHGLNTVRQIIKRWAPESENNTVAYVNAVAAAMGVGPDDELDLDAVETMLPLVKAIITHENGRNPYKDDVIREGLFLAGIADARPKSPVKKIAALCGAGATSLMGAVTDPDKLQHAQGFLQPVVGISPVLKGVFVAVTMGLLALTMLGLSKNHQKGL